MYFKEQLDITQALVFKPMWYFSVNFLKFWVAIPKEINLALPDFIKFSDTT
jgi:hypothetical protein